MREFEELGVTRVSAGPFTRHVPRTALQDAAAELAEGGVLPAATCRLD